MKLFLLKKVFTGPMNSVFLLKRVLTGPVNSVQDPLENMGCKVEFIQPSNWLYSVPNLLVIQHLVTLYLGGFDVRVVSEIE